MKSHFCKAEGTTLSYKNECNWCGEKEMTQDEITNLLWEAIDTAGEKFGNVWTLYDNVVERFAALVAANEREACAKVCKDIANSQFKSGESETAGVLDHCAAAIRSRSSEH